ncbi:MAG TPA: biotin/lipoyl-binding protein, partial [Smithellaceae bacterium]|nr:biotin/lipoyl-binding protein [Smithellaceae bacterium]HPL31904.1 biotin/lipoyl-binding protein [Smithellaceae bacterium]
MPREDLSKLKIDSSARKNVAGGRKKKPFLIAGAMILLAVGVILYRLGVIAPSATVDVTTVSMIYPAQSLSVLNASGYIVAQRKAAVASKVTGRLTELLVEEGSRVRKGQILARMESGDVAAMKEQGTANLANARAMLKQALVERDHAAQENARYQKLIAGGYVAQSDYDMIHTRYLRSLEAVKAAQAAVESAGAALAHAEVNLDYTLIRAPFDGVVLTKNADVGD